MSVRRVPCVSTTWMWIMFGVPWKFIVSGIFSSSIDCKTKFQKEYNICCKFSNTTTNMLRSWILSLFILSHMLYQRRLFFELFLMKYSPLIHHIKEFHVSFYVAVIRKKWNEESDLAWGFMEFTRGRISFVPWRGCMNLYLLRVS